MTANSKTKKQVTAIVCAISGALLGRRIISFGFVGWF
jgi:hypothetical protein